MNFDRSALSLRLYMGTFPLIMLTRLTECITSTFLYISLCKTCDLGGGTIFGRQCYIYNIKALGLMVSNKKLFYVFLI